MTTQIVALQSLHIAIVKAPGVRALPGSLQTGSKLGKGSFQALFAKNLDLADDTGLLSRIASLLQQGVPMATITNRIAAKLTNALAGAVGEPVDARARSTLQRALSKALSPPGSSPPQGTPAQQAAALEQRVKDLLAKLTGATQAATTTATVNAPAAGQKSEFSGNILDTAKTVKDIPAPQKSTTSPVEFSTDDIAALTHSLLQAAASAAQAAAPPPSPTRAAPPQATAPAAAASSKATPPANPAASGDLLTRMVARAVNAAAQRSGTLVQQPQTQMPAPGQGSQPAAAAVFARLIALAGQNPGTQTGGYGGFGQTPEQSKDAPVQNAPRNPGDPSPMAPQNAAPASPFSGHLVTAQAQTPGSAFSYSTVDPNAVVEQVLKGITVGKNGENSEIRLHLQPESLGDVSLKLTVNGTSVAANVVAQSAHVRDILLANQQQLARSLAEAGLSLGNFSVDVSGGGAGFSGGGSQQHHQHFAGSRPGAFGAVLAAQDDTWGDTRFGPPVLTGSKAIVLNYLA